MAGKPWIATAPLFVGMARAFNPGDVVPDEHVEQYGWHDGVTREGSKAATEAQTPDEGGLAQAPAVPPKP